MPRANPEVVTQAFAGQYQSYGYPVSNTNHILEVWRRTYVSGNTVGFPNVSPLPFNGHDVTIRRASWQPNCWFNEWRNPYRWHTFSGPSAGMGVSVIGPDYHIPFSSLFGNESGELRARAKVISKIQRIKANVAQNVAEYRQVSGMFDTNIRRVTNAYRALRRGDVRGLGREIPLRRRHQQSLLNRGPLNIRSTAPSVWLEVQYGWNPLLGDIYTGLTNFYSRVEEGIPIRAVGRATSVTHDSVKLDPDISYISFNDSSTTRYRNMYIIEYEVDNSQLANLDDWGITNPALLAWELVPYSFVVDWFYPVGDWLSQVGYSLGLHFRRGMRTSNVTRLTSRRFKSTSTWPSNAIGNDSFQTIKLRREVLGGFPDVGRPVFDPGGLRGKRIANALSLLSLAFDRRR